jgi:hypothetical protein
VRHQGSSAFFWSWSSANWRPIEHADGATDFGTFEGKAMTSSGQVTIEGKFTTTGGTGRLAGISGGGSYKGAFISPTEIKVA